MKGEGGHCEAEGLKSSGPPQRAGEGSHKGQW